jgi:DNA-binding NtrC family response regulator
MLADGPRLSEADIRGIVIPAELPADTPGAPPVAEHSGTYDEALAAFERELITRALQQSGGRVTEAARKLGLGRATLYKKMAALDISSRS